MPTDRDPEIPQHLLPKRPSTKRIVTRPQLRFVYSGKPAGRETVVRRRLIHVDFILARRAAAKHMAQVVARMAAALDAWAETK